MPLQLFLNELSSPNTNLSRAESVGHLQNLVATVRHARNIDRACVLNSEVPLSNFRLSAGETISSVRNQGECVEESLFLKTINNRAPMKLAAPEAGQIDPDLCEYRIQQSAPVCGGQVALGLGFAHLLAGLGLSLASHELWLERLIELDLTTLDVDGEVASAEVTARNADCPAAIDHHAQALRALLAPTINDGAELWARRAELLPNLVFIPRTRAQIEGILQGDPILEQAWIKLSGINQAVASWKITKGPHPIFAFNTRPESKSRRALAEFKDANGYKRIFSQHCDLAPTECRIHFIVETDPESHVIIGHIGRKLGIG